MNTEKVQEQVEHVNSLKAKLKQLKSGDLYYVAFRMSDGVEFQDINVLEPVRRATIKALKKFIKKCEQEIKDEVLRQDS